MLFFGSRKKKKKSQKKGVTGLLRLLFESDSCFATSSFVRTIARGAKSEDHIRVSFHPLVGYGSNLWFDDEALRKSEERAVSSLFSPGGTHAMKGEFAGMTDFEVLAYLVVLPGAAQSTGATTTAAPA